MERIDGGDGIDRDRELRALLTAMDPELRPGGFVFVTLPLEQAARVPAEAMVREDGGVAAVLRRVDAEEAGLPYEFVGAWITLRVRSGLDAVGLTAAVAVALAAEGVSCNLLAGTLHDHLIVPVERADDAMRILHALSASQSDAGRV